SSAAVAHKSTPHPWLSLITVRVHGDDPELLAGKPAPDVFLLAARRLGVEARNCWAFEDSPAGATAAVHAGCRVHVLAPSGLPRQAYPAEVIWLDSLETIRL
ncbi:MAG: HAD family hydrolase, partial [Cyanobacteriota bacterium]